MFTCYASNGVNTKTVVIFHSQHIHIISIKIGLINTSRFIKSRNCILLHLNVSFKTAWGLIPGV